MAKVSYSTLKYGGVKLPLGLMKDSFSLLKFVWGKWKIALKEWPNKFVQWAQAVASFPLKVVVSPVAFFHGVVKNVRDFYKNVSWASTNKKENRYS